MNEIFNNLYQGDRIDAIQAALFESVDVVVYLGQNMDAKQLMYESKIPLIHFPLNDGENPQSKYTILLELLDFLLLEQGYKVLISCRYGTSRSPSIVLLHLTENENFVFEEAYDLLKDKIATFPDLTKPETYLRKMLNSIKAYYWAMRNGI